MNFERPQNLENLEGQILTPEEKISLIEKKLNINYSEEERKDFDEWIDSLPENSIENPIQEIIDLLPTSANYKNERINLFFSKERFLTNELHLLLEKFARQNPSFEISVVSHDDNLISVGIGNKVRNGSTLLSGSYFGHYHPTNLKLENIEKLPRSFVAGLMPSSGDLRGFFKFHESVKDGTKIFSKNGYVEIKRVREIENPQLVLKKFKEKYFDLFLGENKLNMQADDDISRFFENTFGYKLEFHYFSEEEK